MSPRDPALDTAGRFGSFLNRTIKELKPVDEFQSVRTEPPKAMPAMPAKPLVNKFTELAGKVAQSQKAMGERADALSIRLDKLNEKADGAFTKHESHLDQAEGGLDAMEEALSGLIGHNGPND